MSKREITPASGQQKKFLFSVFLPFRGLVRSKIQCFCDVMEINCEIAEYKYFFGSYYVVTATGRDVNQLEILISRLRWAFSS